MVAKKEAGIVTVFPPHFEDGPILFRAPDA